MGYLYRRGRGKKFYTAVKKNGRWIWKSTGTSNKDLAKEVLRQRERQAINGEDEVIPLAFNQFCHQELENQRSRVAPKTATRYGEIVKNLTEGNSPLRNVLVQEINIRLVVQYINQRLQAHRSKGTVQKEIYWLLSALDEAARAGYTTRAAVALLKDDFSPKRKMPALKGANRSRKRILYPFEMDILDKAVGKNANLREAICVALFTGLRSENILELSEDQVDFSCEPAVLRYLADDIKNDESLTVRLCPKVQAILWQRWQGIPGRKLFRDFRPTWKRAVKRSGLKDLRFHDLRRSYITYRLAAGIDPKNVQAEVGHLTSRMTMDSYAQPIQDPAVRAWAMQNFRFPWDPLLPAALPNTTYSSSQITSHSAILNRKSGVSD